MIAPLGQPVRRIAHLDMDAFFASVELLTFPDLKGQAVVVGGRRTPAPTIDASEARQYTRLKEYVGRGVITTSTYEARALGVFSGMGLMKAAALAPDAILLPANFEAYRHYSRLFKAAVATIAPHIEDRGIDEIYIDLSAHPEPPEVLGARIKSAVRAATGLSCSIAIAPNKLLAKIGSDLDKPDGLTLIEIGDMPSRIWPLAVSKINGVGPKANARLEKMGILTIGQLAATPVERLIRHFGSSMGAWLGRVAQGIDTRPVITESTPKSISRESTFERDLHPQNDKHELSGIFTDLCKRVESDLERKGYASRTIGIKLRFADFSIVTRDLTLPAPVMDALDIRRAAGECLKRITLDRRIRLLGVRASTLVSRDALMTADSPVQQKFDF